MDEGSRVRGRQQGVVRGDSQWEFFGEIPQPRRREGKGSIDISMTRLYHNLPSIGKRDRNNWKRVQGKNEESRLGPSSGVEIGSDQVWVWS